MTTQYNLLLLSLLLRKRLSAVVKEIFSSSVFVEPNSERIIDGSDDDGSLGLMVVLGGDAPVSPVVNKITRTDQRKAKERVNATNNR